MHSDKLQAKHEKTSHQNFAIEGAQAPSVGWLATALRVKRIGAQLQPETPVVGSLCLRKIASA